MAVSRPARVALVIGQLTVGGAEGQLRELTKGLDRRRFEPLVYSLAAQTGRLQQVLEADGIPVRVIGAGGLTRTRRLVDALHRDAVVLMHSWLFIANTYAWVARLLGARIPLVTSARNCKSQGLVHHLANCAAFRASDRIVANSEQVRQYIQQRYAAPAARIRVIHNGVDTHRFHPEEHDGGRPTIMTAGRLVTQKNPFLFLEAAALLRQDVPNARFVMVGEGPLRSAIEARAGELGVADALELVGEQAGIERYLVQADLFWLTSSWEGLPNVVLEAMASGLPVVTTDVGGVRELIRSAEAGIVVPAGDAAAFAAHGARVLRDRRLRAAMGAAARRTAETFSLERMIAATAAVYDECLSHAA